jgi:hypothetical protein
MARRIAAACAALFLALVAGVWLFRVASEPPGPVKREEFARVLRQVASLARETAVLCDQIAQNRLTGPFARTHREKLDEDLRDQAHALEASAPPDLEQAAAAARELAADLAANLRTLKLHLAEAQALADVHREAGRIATQLERLEPR